MKGNLLNKFFIVFLLCLSGAWTTSLNAQLLEQRGKLKTTEKEKENTFYYKGDKEIKKNKKRPLYQKPKVKYSKKRDNTFGSVKPSSGSEGFKNAEGPRVKYGKERGIPRKESVNPKYSEKRKSDRAVVNPKYSSPNQNTKKEIVNPRYSERGRVKKEVVEPLYSIKEKEKKVQVYPRYSIREKGRKVEVNPKYSEDLGYDNTKKVVPRSITGEPKYEKRKIAPLYSIYEPFDNDFEKPLSISGEGMVYDNRKERRKNAVRNDARLASFEGLESDPIIPDHKKTSLAQSGYRGNDKYMSETRIERKERKVTAEYADFVGPKTEYVKRTSNMHPSSAYLDGERNSPLVRELKRGLNIFWIRMNGNKNIPENVKKQEKQKPGRDKKEGDIWVY